jgi:hypothetical protein
LSLILLTDIDLDPIIYCAAVTTRTICPVGDGTAADTDLIYAWNIVVVRTSYIQSQVARQFGGVSSSSSFCLSPIISITVRAEPLFPHILMQRVWRRIVEAAKMLMNRLFYQSTINRRRLLSVQAMPCPVQTFLI